jgi:hypothetical protein
MDSALRERADPGYVAPDDQRLYRLGALEGVQNLDLERSARGGVGAYLAAAWTGTSIARLRIFPVGPFGSSSTNHTWRGYL